MAIEEVTGKTEDQIEELRQEFYSSPSNWSSDAKEFEEAYCLARIPNQPDDYEGPQRYCVKSTDLRERGDNHLCKHHGGAVEHDITQYAASGPMKSGLQATQENLRKNFDAKDRSLYDWIVDRYNEQYDLTAEEHPGTAYDLHRLAMAIVRAERGRGQIVEEGEVTEEPVRNEEGQIVTDEKGDIVTEKSEHYLAKMMNRQDNKITKLEKELGITRKEMLRRDQTDDAIDAVKNFADLGSAFLDRDEKDYDPEAQPWKDS